MVAGQGRKSRREEVLARVDIVEVVSRYVDIEARGRDWFGLCPFHTERTPSFTVSPTKQFFYCFGCSMSGDAIRFVEEMEGISTEEAYERLAGRSPTLSQRGEEVAATAVVPRQQEEVVATAVVPRQQEEVAAADAPSQQELRRALQYTVALYQRCLSGSPAEDAVKARAYVEERQLTKETVDLFALGFASVSTPLLVQFFTRRGFSMVPLRMLGLLTAQDQERFANRLIIPIHDAQGRVVGLGGRRLPGEEGDEPKYVNSAASPLFQKGEHLFNWHRARTSIRTAGQVVLLEGYMDVLAAWQAGVTHSVGVLGTSLGEKQARMLCRLQDRVVLAFDSDPAGEKATLRSIGTLQRFGGWVTIANLPAQKDPDELIRTEGKEAFQEALQTARSAIAFRLLALRRGYDLTQEVDRHRYLHCAMKVLADATAIEREHHLRSLSEEFSIPQRDLLMEWQRVAGQQGRYARSGRSTGPSQRLAEVPLPPPSLSGGPIVGTRQASSVRSRIEASERMLLSLMMRYRSITLWVQQAVGDGFPTDRYAALAAHLYAYYAQVDVEGDPDGFLTDLKEKNPTLLAEAESLLDWSMPLEAMDLVLQDCLHHVRMHSLVNAVEENEAHFRWQQKQGNMDQALQLLAKTVKLQQLRMAREKTTQARHAFMAPSPPPDS